MVPLAVIALRVPCGEAVEERIDYSRASIVGAVEYVFDDVYGRGRALHPGYFRDLLRLFRLADDVDQAVDLVSYSTEPEDYGVALALLSPVDAA